MQSIESRPVASFITGVDSPVRAEAHPDPCSCFRLPGDPATLRHRAWGASNSRGRDSSRR